MISAHVRGTILSLALVLILSAVANAQDGEVTVQGKFAPPDGKVIFMVGQSLNEISDYVGAAGTVPGGLMFYTSVQNLDGLDRPSGVWSGVNNGSTLVSRYSNSVMQIGLWMVGAEQEIIDGVYDDNITKIAKWVKNANCPVFIRVGYEFDFPENNYDPELYVKAYRHFVDKMRALKADNAAYVWHSYGVVREIPLSKWYPGDEYVDWFGISFFAQGVVNMKKMAFFAKTKGKPLMLAEVTPFGTGVLEGEGSWNKWFAGMFKFIKANNVKALCYINCNWEMIGQFKGQGWGNSRVQDNSYVFEQWKKEIYGNDSFLQASPELFAELGYKPKK